MCVRSHTSLCSHTCMHMCYTILLYSYIPASRCIHQQKTFSYGTPYPATMLSLWLSARCTSHQAYIQVPDFLSGKRKSQDLSGDGAHNTHISGVMFFFFSWKENLGTCIQVLQKRIIDEIGLMASASSREPQ